MSSMEDVILGRRAGRMAEESADTFVEGKIKRVTDEGAFFTVPEWDDGKHVFGPAPWPMSRVEKTASGDHAEHDHEATKPPVGSRCVILFLGTGVDRPWILGWWV